ncbi:hypothetical protein E2C01_023623 [Portunus trituberculatus]|uniref:Uncharacterized protein n=1 Tax=Portunus trituberculatus TaxID=210409 RepID=A0A5B7E8H1_PORTR|nr:hypothetical protein [Portunus trituberculatus]
MKLKLRNSTPGSVIIQSGSTAVPHHCLWTPATWMIGGTGHSQNASLLDVSLSCTLNTYLCTYHSDTSCEYRYGGVQLCSSVLVTYLVWRISKCARFTLFPSWDG